MFDILLTDEAKEQLNRLKTDKGLAKRYNAVNWYYGPGNKEITIVAITPHP